MLRELLSILRPGDTLNVMGERFTDMLKLTCEMTHIAGDIYFGKSDPGERTRIYDMDVRVNKLERLIRKRVVAHLSISGNTPDLPHGLLMMSVVKDVERIGDYAKNLTEVTDLHSGEFPDDAIVAELRELRAGVEEAFRATSSVFVESDHERALNLIRHGKDLARRADGLLQRIAHSKYDAENTTALVLGTRYYKRIGGHLLNVLSSVVMPLHKIDYYDEKELPG